MDNQTEAETHLKLELSLDEINTILKALSQEPFKDVFQLIGKINEQAAIQLNEPET